MQLTAHSLVNKSLNLVSPPSTYARLTELIHDPHSAIDAISEVINADPALTTRLLKIVNSPFYGFPSQINTISRAIAVIGTHELTQLVLATSVVKAFTGIPDELIKVRTFWQHSIACAICAKLLAQAAGYQHSEQYLIAGLLHNIGSLVLYQSVPELAAEAIKSARFGHEVLHLAEQRIIGFDHTEAGEALIQAWRLPESLAFVARHHHSPLAAGYTTEVCIVHVADVMISAVPFGHSGDQHVPPLDPVAWQRLNLPAEIIPPLLRKVATQLEHMTAGLL